MARSFDTLAELRSHGCDTVIDVRSPAEFALDHVPGAINLPVLSNAERAEVGTIYVQDSPFRARKIGAAMVFRNASAHIAGPLAGHDGAWRPLVYCWRGGQRSGAFTWMLREIGWRAEVIAGGYQSYRRLVHDMLYKTPLPHRLVLLDGNTGTAKTEVLARLQERGVQVIDLEGLARHRGSLLGDLPGGQPGQKAFESGLADALIALDPQRPTVVEAESSKIGQINLPPSLWEAMKTAPRLHVTAPMAARARYLAEAYEDVLSDHDRLARKLSGLVAHRGRAIVEGWLALSAAGDKVALTRALMEQHYDPAYAKARSGIEAPIAGEIEADGLDDAGIETLADRIAEQLHASER